jgi:hypothetical protein
MAMTMDDWHGAMGDLRETVKRSGVDFNIEERYTIYQK